jgi:hypothetical protein
VSQDQLDEIARQLSDIVERLDEVAFEALRSAFADGQTVRPDVERRAVRARNALERARRILEAGEGGPDGPEPP